MSDFGVNKIYNLKKIHQRKKGASANEKTRLKKYKKSFLHIEVSTQKKFGKGREDRL